MANFNFEAIGTSWQITTELPLVSTVMDCISKTIEDFDCNFSRFRDDSMVSEMSKKPGNYHIPQSGAEMLDLYYKINELTSGFVTPLIGNLPESAGYDRNYSLKPGKLSPPPSWGEAIYWENPNLNIKIPVLLDFGACGKGRLVDLVADDLIANTLNSFSVDAGGDIRQHNLQERIGLENPNNLTEVIGICEMKNGSICGSAGNRRSWGEFHHIFNPKNLKSVSDVKSVWVAAENTMLADMFSTCLFFVEPEVLKSEFDFEYLILYPDNTFNKSSKFPGKLFF